MCITWSIHVHVVHLTEMLLHIITNYGAFRPHPLLIILPSKIYFLDRTLNSNRLERKMIKCGLYVQSIHQGGEVAN